VISDFSLGSDVGESLALNCEMLAALGQNRMHTGPVQRLLARAFDVLSEI